MPLIMIFTMIALVSFALFYYGTGKDKRVLLLLPWGLLIGSLAYAGFFQKTDTLPPRIVVVIVPAVLYVIWLYRKLPVQHLASRVLLSIHILRVPVELVLYRLYHTGKIPVIMTFEGWNFDILVGITAALLWLYTLITGRNISHKLFKVWNILGLVFLGIIVCVATLSAPSPVQTLAFDRPNLAIISFPFTLLPAVIVPVVLLSHLLCLKAMGHAVKTGATP
jgi:hypothetical protein